MLRVQKNRPSSLQATETGYTTGVTPRLPFDPGKMSRKDKPAKGPKAPSSSRPRGLSASSSDGQPLTVTQLAASIESAIKDTFPSKVRVIAEVSSVTNRTHYYFTLKDESATISAVLFASAAKRSRTLPAHGQKVIVTGKLDYYAPTGRLSLIVDKLEPAGQGDLEQRFKDLCDDLRARGWFDPESKRPLPVFPRSIAIITSATGAALQDVLDTASKRCPAVNMLVVDVRVQGDQSKSQIARALNSISAQHEHLGIDAVILTRGGGALEDLWSFNEPVVATAVHHCPIPIVAAIGHETDTTIAELVADERAATPTQAAMKLVPDRAALYEQLDSLTRRLTRELTTELANHASHLSRLSSSGPLANPARLIEPSAAKLPALIHRLQSSVHRVNAGAARELDSLALRLSKHQPAAVHATRREHIAGLSRQLTSAINHRLKNLSTNLTATDRELNAIAPRQVLSRGYSLTTSSDGALIRSTKDLNPNDQIITHLQDGVVRSTVASQSRETKPKRSPSKPKNPKTNSEPSLFKKD